MLHLALDAHTLPGQSRGKQANIINACKLEHYSYVLCSQSQKIMPDLN